MPQGVIDVIARGVDLVRSGLPCALTNGPDPQGKR